MTANRTPLFPEVAVNGERIPPQAIAAEVQNHPVAGVKPGLAWRRAAGALAIKTLLLQEAARRGVKAEPQRSGRNVETEEEALIRGLLEDALTVEPVGYGEVRAEWERDPTRFRAPPLWEVSHILFRNESRQTTASPSTAKFALEVTGEARSNPERFPELARRHSDCESARSGGRLGQIRPGDTVPEFEAALRSLEKGEITATPVSTRYGWHVIKIDASEQGRVLPFAAVMQKISDALEKAAWTRSAKEFVGQLVAAAHIEGIDMSSDSRTQQT